MTNLCKDNITLIHERHPDAPVKHQLPPMANLAATLLAAPDMSAAAAQIVAYVTTQLRCFGAVLVWSPDLPDGQQQFPPLPLTTAQITRTRAALQQAVAAPPDEGGHIDRMLCSVGAHGYAVLLANVGDDNRDAVVEIKEWDSLVITVRPHLLKTLELARLDNTIQRLLHSERVQQALFAISDLSSSDLDMTDMLRALHQIVGALMYTENIYILLYNAETDTVRYVYFADVLDSFVADPNDEIPLESIRNGVTWYLIRNGRPLRGTTQQLREQGCEMLVPIGPESIDRLGVPMLVGSTVRGAIFVHTYSERPRYTADDQSLLSFMATHILIALDRKQAQAELERRVALRTQELAVANVSLMGEVEERQRAERLQNALFRIAELGNTALGMEHFFRAVHGVIGKLINAKNFYIALLSEDRSTLIFHYSVDEREAVRGPRPLADGAAEMVLRSGTPMLLDAMEMQRMIDLRGTGLGEAARSWLGVPLICAGNVLGVVAVQSYSSEVNYTVYDQELLSFVSSQIARGLERQRAAEDIHAANAELEQRVDTRTHELRLQVDVRERVEQTLKQRNLELETVNQQLAGAQTRLLQTEKMASVGQLAAGVAHEINNPISFVHSNLFSLRNYVEDLLAVLKAYDAWADAPTDAAKAEQLAAVKKEFRLGFVCEDILALMRESAEGIQRVRKIVQDLKDFSHVGEAEWQEVDIHDCLERTLNVLKHDIAHRLSVVKHYGPVPLIRCLPFQINQVLLNVLLNAAESIEHRGTINISTDLDGDAVRVRIADSGRGIEPALRKRIFDPFFTTKPVGAGTGLGLSVAYGIVQQHGGRIEVESQIGIGTTISVWLPVKNEHVPNTQV